MSAKPPRRLCRPLPGLFNTVAFTALLSLSSATAKAVTLDWKGLTWQVTSGAMAGVCAGDPANVSVDGSGYLHLKLSKQGGTWSAAELFSSERLGFGTFQWQVDGAIDALDPNVVLGLFPYGPQAGIGSDGTNEIDIEYSRWGQPTGPNGDFTDYPASGKTTGESSFSFSLAGSTLTTSRFDWSSSAITDFLFKGLVDVNQTNGFLATYAYVPANPTQNIPQQALPLGMNLWCFDAPPSDGKEVEIVIRDFVFVPEGEQGGSAGAGGDGGMSGTSTTSAGTTSLGGRGGTVAGGAGHGGGTSGSGGAETSAGGSGTGGASAGAPSSGGMATSAGGSGMGGVSPAGGRSSSSSGAPSATAGAPSATAAPRSSSGCSCGMPSSAPASYGASTLFALVTLAFSRRRRPKA